MKADHCVQIGGFMSNSLKCVPKVLAILGIENGVGEHAASDDVTCGEDGAVVSPVIKIFGHEFQPVIAVVAVGTIVPTWHAVG